MILTAAFIIAKALGAPWSWYWLLLTVFADGTCGYTPDHRNKGD